MDFDDWLREQLAAERHPQAPASEIHRRRPGISRRFRTALQLAGLGIAAGAVLFGATLQLNLSEVQVRALSSAPALPATTWAGTPPAPAPALDESTHSGTDDRPAAAPGPDSVPAADSSGQVITSRSSDTPTSEGSDDHSAPPATIAAAQPPPPSSRRTFSLVGGTATIACQGSSASLVSATPNPGFQVETDSQDGGTAVEVRFRSTSHESKLEASCSAGVIQGQVEESSS